VTALRDAYVTAFRYGSRALGRDPKQAARALDRVGYEHIMRRIVRQGF
jgi:hypothetical protein